LVHPHAANASRFAVAKSKVSNLEGPNGGGSLERNLKAAVHNTGDVTQDNSFKTTLKPVPMEDKFKFLVNWRSMVNFQQLDAVSQEDRLLEKAFFLDWLIPQFMIINKENALDNRGQMTEIMGFEVEIENLRDVPIDFTYIIPLTNYVLGPIDRTVTLFRDITVEVKPRKKHIFVINTKDLPRENTFPMFWNQAAANRGLWAHLLSFYASEPRYSQAGYQFQDDTEMISATVRIAYSVYPSTALVQGSLRNTKMVCKEPVKLYQTSPFSCRDVQPQLQTSGFAILPVMGCVVTNTYHLYLLNMEHPTPYLGSTYLVLAGLSHCVAYKDCYEMPVTSVYKWFEKKSDEEPAGYYLWDGRALAPYEGKFYLPGAKIMKYQQIVTGFGGLPGCLYSEDHRRETYAELRTGFMFTLISVCSTVLEVAKFIQKLRSGKN
jgi:hypothetical protein